MSRLIDADKLIEDIELMQIFIKGLRSGKSFLADMLERYIEEVKKTINKQPTAYNVDKVVEQLDDCQSYYVGRSNSIYKKCTVELEKVLEIVEVGGITES